VLVYENREEVVRCGGQRTEENGREAVGMQWRMKKQR
jgi:hypothetical protein